MNNWKEEKHRLFESCEELIREVQEQLLWWVGARNRARDMMFWALRASPKDVCPTFELLRDAYKEIEINLKQLKKLRGLQLELWRIETTVQINILPGDRRKE